MVGIGVGAIVIAAIAGWVVPVVVIGVVVVIIGIATNFSAEVVIRNALQSAAVDAVFGFDVTFDQSWWSIITTTYRQAQAAVRTSDIELDDAFEQLFVHYLEQQGYERQF